MIVYIQILRISNDKNQLTIKYNSSCEKISFSSNNCIFVIEEKHCFT